MADLTPWRGFGKRLEEARLKSGLKLRQIDSGVSMSTLSRVENGGTAPTEGIVQRYAELTGEADLLLDFQQRVESSRRAAGSIDSDAPPSFQSVIRLTNFEALVDVGETILLTERRTIVAVQPTVSRVRLLGQALPIAGARPELLEAYAYGAEVFERTWIDENLLALDIEFPIPIERGASEYTFYLRRRFDRLSPWYTHMAGYPLARFVLSITFARPGYKTVLVDGIPGQVTTGAIEAFLAGKSDALPAEPLVDQRHVTHTFSMKPALSYGLAWLAPDLHA